MAEEKSKPDVSIVEIPVGLESKEALSSNPHIPSQDAPQNVTNKVPLAFKIISILLVSGIGFGSSWSSGVTGAMKSTLKKVEASPITCMYLS